MACWRKTASNIGCPTQWWGRRYEIDNSIDNPLLPYPDYIPHALVFCDNPANDGGHLDFYWGQYCNPLKAAYPIVNIGNYPITKSPILLDIARSPSTAPVPEYYLDRGFAIASRITPTSKCLPYIVFHNAYNQVVGKKTIVEIRKNDPATNLPMGVPGDGNIFGKVAVEFATGLPNYAVPVNTILDEIDVPVWVILYSDDYACSNAFIGSANRRLKLSKSDAGSGNVAVFNQANGCAWAIDNTVNSIALASYKAPACNGTVIVSDYAFAKMGTPPIYLNDNCFVRLAEVEGANVAIGVKYTNPDPIRAWKRVRFSFAYRKPDLRYFTGIQDVFDVPPGQYETFFDMNELYFPGEYDELFVSAEVIQV